MSKLEILGTHPSSLAVQNNIAGSRCPPVDGEGHKYADLRNGILENTHWLAIKENTGIVRIGFKCGCGDGLDADCAWC
jgi:hypothetical protein